MADNEESIAGFQGQSAAPMGNAAALQYQHFTTDTNAHGFLGGTLGRGNRSVPSPGSFFSSPPPATSQGRNLSGGQFGNGNSKSVLADDEGEND